MADIGVTPAGGSESADSDAFLRKALEQFLGKSQQEIHSTLLETLSGHTRAILASLTVEEIYGDREMFARLVREIASPDLAKFGISILSFTIKDISDKQNYLASLGSTQTAVVKRDADIGIAEANRDASIARAQCEQKRKEARYEADSNIANAARDFQTRSAGFDQEVLLPCHTGVVAIIIIAGLTPRLGCATGEPKEGRERTCVPAAGGASAPGHPRRAA